MTQLYSTYHDFISSFKNKIINGNFDIWQRGTSQTSSGYGAEDRWVNNHSGTTKTASRQSFTVGQTDVPNNPKYYSRTVVSSSAGSSNYALKVQLIESVRTLAGNALTLSFWAKADSSKNIAVELLQTFGTGGSPSSFVSFNTSTCSLTSTWQKFTITTTSPSISGKTLGSDGNDALSVYFWFDAGSDYDSRTNSLGQQSGTFDIAQVQLEEGYTATPFEKRHFGIELELCQRYYEKSFSLDTAPADNVEDGMVINPGVSDGSYVYSQNDFKVRKRTSSPTITYYQPSGVSGVASQWSYFDGSIWDLGNTTSTDVVSSVGVRTTTIPSGASSGHSYLLSGHWTCSDEL